MAASMPRKPDSVLLTLRLDRQLHDWLETMAHAEGFEPAAYVQRLIRLNVAQSDLMPGEERERVLLTEDMIARAVARAIALDRAGRFDAHFTLTVLDELFADPAFVADYERAIGGPALARGLPAKASLNMSLGWQIKAAVRATPLLDDAGRTRRAQVRGRPFQSYTLLTRPNPEKGA